VVRRPSLPLTERDERELALLRSSAAHREALDRLTALEAAAAELSESALLHAVFDVGLRAIRDEIEESGYALLAAEQGDASTSHRAEARRRPPAWAHEK
jgi:hypothetical protein